MYIRGQRSTPKRATCCVNLNKSPNSLSLSSCGESNGHAVFYFSKLSKNDMQYLKNYFLSQVFYQHWDHCFPVHHECEIILLTPELG